MKEQIVFQPNEGQKNVFQPDVEMSIQQEPMSREQLKELLGVELNDPSLKIVKESLPEIAVISDERAMTLFWWWSIDSINRGKGTWRDTLTPEERVLVESWDVTSQEEN